MNRGRRSVLGAAVVLLAVGSGVEAQDHAAPRKSTATGRWISVVATAAPVAVGLPLAIAGERANESGPSTAGGILLMLGEVFGPSAGHIYADNADRAGDGVLIRFGILAGTAMIGMALAPPDADPRSNSDAGVIALAVGGAALLAFIVVDILNVEKSVAEHTARRTAPAVSAAPYIDPQDRAVGLQLAVGW